MLALNATQFLVLSRDSSGLGTGNATPIDYKSVLLVDKASATNIAGSGSGGTVLDGSPVVDAKPCRMQVSPAHSLPRRRREARRLLRAVPAASLLWWRSRRRSRASHPEATPQAGRRISASPARRSNESFQFSRHVDIPI